MRSIFPDDPTTRSRIQEAALLLFGRDGYRATTVRAIAEHAGVSAGLVIHHFGSKEQLRTACDDQVTAELVAWNSDVDESDMGETIQRWLADLVTFQPALDYLARMLSEGTDAGGHLFDNLVDYTERMLADGVADGSMHASSDPRVRAVMIASYGLVPMLLGKLISRSLGVPVLEAAGVSRLTLPTLELYTHGLYRTDAVLAATRAAFGSTSPDENGRTK